MRWLLIFFAPNSRSPPYIRMKWIHRKLSASSVIIFVPREESTRIRENALKDFKGADVYVIELKYVKGISYLISKIGFDSLRFVVYLIPFLKILRSVKATRVVLSVPSFWLLWYVPLVRKFLNAEIYLDIRDPILTNPFRTTPRFIREIEVRLVHGTRAILASPTYRLDAERIQLQTIGVFYNIMGYLDLGGKSLRIKKPRCVYGSNDKIRIGYFGSIYGGRLKPFLRLLKLEGDYEIDVYGEVPEYIIREHTGKIRKKPRLEPEEYMLSLSAYDYLLLLQNFGRVIQIPTKLFDYLGVPSPVLYVGGDGIVNLILDAVKKRYVFIDEKTPISGFSVKKPEISKKCDAKYICRANKFIGGLLDKNCITVNILRK